MLHFTFKIMFYPPMDLWYISLYDSELYNGSLLLSEYIYKNTGCRTSFKYCILNLFKLGYYHKIIDILEGVDLNDYDIRISYYKSLVETETNKKIKNVPLSSYKKPTISNILDNHSIEKFWYALTKKDILKKELLIEAYRLDNKNIECLYFLIKDEMCTDKEFLDLLQLNQECKLLSDIFLFPFSITNEIENVSVDVLEFYHPFYAFIFSKKLFIEKKKLLLFNLSHKSYRIYMHCTYTYLSLALYFFLIEDYEEAKRILLKSFEFDKRTGLIYMYLGICYSRLRECEKSLNCFNISNRKIVCTWKTYYYLACEYQKMTNFDKAKFYYLEGLNVDRNIMLQEGYISLLIFCESYQEALSYISGIIKSKETRRLNNILLLKSYCYLFLGNLNESKDALEKCRKDYRYFCTKGYIEHLTNNIDLACDFYNKSLLLKNSSVIEDLMTSATRQNKENDVYNSCTEIFEYVFISNQDIEII